VSAHAGLVCRTGRRSWRGARSRALDRHVAGDDACLQLGQRGSPLSQHFWVWAPADGGIGGIGGA
jgi:hypothetical protein